MSRNGRYMTKFVAISDTHSKHRNIKLPEGDVLLHAGDMSMIGRPDELIDFNNWLSTLPFQHKILCPGNHDWLFEENEQLARSLVSQATVLINEAITINGVKIYGLPQTPRFHDWAFNVDRNSPEMKKLIDAIPDDTNILVSHGPPWGILDAVPVKTKYDEPPLRWENTGCKQLRLYTESAEHLKYHLFGHIHEGAGLEKQQGINFVNVSQLNERYQLVHEPYVFEINK